MSTLAVTPRRCFPAYLSHDECGDARTRVNPQRRYGREQVRKNQEGRRRRGRWRTFSGQSAPLSAATRRGAQVTPPRAGGIFDINDDSDPVVQVLLSEGNDALPPLLEVCVTIPEDDADDSQRTINVVKPPGPSELFDWFEARSLRDADPSWVRMLHPVPLHRPASTFCSCIVCVYEYLDHYVVCVPVPYKICTCTSFVPISLLRPQQWARERILQIGSLYLQSTPCSFVWCRLRVVIKPWRCPSLRFGNHLAYIEVTSITLTSRRFSSFAAQQDCA